MFESLPETSLPVIGQGTVRTRAKPKPLLGDADEFRVENTRKKRLKAYDKFLKSFKYSAALDSVLRKVSMI
jgi:U3 small nucleolar RNA-associated protein 15